MSEMELRKWAYEQVSKWAGTGFTPDYLMNRADELVAWVQQKGAAPNAASPCITESAQGNKKSAFADYATVLGSNLPNN